MRRQYPLEAAVLAALVLIAAGSAGAQIYVPGDYPTIGEALDDGLFPEAEIFIAPGIYHEPELVLAYGISLIGTGDVPGDVEIRGDGEHRVITILNTGSVVENLRIANGSATQGGGIAIRDGSVELRDLEIVYCTGNLGGGVYVDSADHLLLERCVISGCEAWTAGGGLYAFNTELVELRGSTVFSNRAGAYGGGWSLARAELMLEGCTVAENSAPLGSEGTSFHGDGVEVSNTIAVDNVPVAGMGGLETVLATDAGDLPGHQCSLRFEPGWLGDLADQLDDPAAHNLEADPLFCGPPASTWADYLGLAANSPALPENNPECGLIGAYGQACGATASPDTPTARCVLHAPYPNPFNPMTHIDYEIARAGPVKLVIYSLDGRRVATLVNEDQAAGTHTATWAGLDDRGRSVASGVYVGRLQADETSAAVRLTLVK